MNEDDVKQAIDTLVKALRSDSEYRATWVANIAMAFVDNFSRRHYPWDSSREEIHTIANKAANEFLDNLCSPTDWTGW